MNLHGAYMVIGGAAERALLLRQPGRPEPEPQPPSGPTGGRGRPAQVRRPADDLTEQQVREHWEHLEALQQLQEQRGRGVGGPPAAVLPEAAPAPVVLGEPSPQLQAVASRLAVPVQELMLQLRDEDELVALILILDLAEATH